jgi:hypothetical protein
LFPLLRLFPSLLLGNIRRRVEEQETTGQVFVPVSNKSSSRFLQGIPETVTLEVQVTCPSTCVFMDIWYIYEHSDSARIAVLQGTQTLDEMAQGCQDQGRYGGLGIENAARINR